MRLLAARGSSCTRQPGEGVHSRYAWGRYIQWHFAYVMETSTSAADAEANDPPAVVVDARAEDEGEVILGGVSSVVAAALGCPFPSSLSLLPSQSSRSCDLKSCFSILPLNSPGPRVCQPHVDGTMMMYCPRTSFATTSVSLERLPSLAEQRICGDNVLSQQIFSRRS